MFLHPFHSVCVSLFFPLARCPHPQCENLCWLPVQSNPTHKNIEGSFIMLMSMEGHGKKGHCCAFHHQFRTANQQCKSCKQNLFVYADGAKRSTARHPTAPWRCRRSLRISCQVQHADLPQTASVPPRGKEGNRDIKQGTHHHFVVCLFF